MRVWLFGIQHGLLHSRLEEMQFLEWSTYIFAPTVIVKRFLSIQIVSK